VGRDGLLASLREHVADERVLAAIATVDRAAFVPPDLRAHAYDDEALPLGEGTATISQPRVVAIMLALLDVHPGHRVLDVGTGSGWHAALLAELGGRVWSVERDPVLAARAAQRLAPAGVTVVEGDGSRGLPDAAPFDRVNVAASAAGDVPPALLEQLAPGGRIVVPVGERLVLLSRAADGTLERRDAGGVRFVPLVE
jgi:protein-L-isoaspartate(D-aspartate) O-methyltransferase